MSTHRKSSLYMKILEINCSGQFFLTDEFLPEVSRNCEKVSKKGFSSCSWLFLVSRKIKDFPKITGHVMISWLLPVCRKWWWMHLHIQRYVYMGIKLIHFIFWVHFWSCYSPSTFGFMIFRENKVFINNLWCRPKFEIRILAILWQNLCYLDFGRIFKLKISLQCRTKLWIFVERRKIFRILQKKCWKLSSRGKLCLLRSHDKLLKMLRYFSWRTNFDFEGSREVTLRSFQVIQIK